MMTSIEMKRVLADKLKDEMCGFTYKDITINKINKNCYHIIIKDYEHILFRMTFEYDDYFDYCVFINEIYVSSREAENIVFIDSKYNYDIKSALITLGYHIANTF